MSKLCMPQIAVQSAIHSALELGSFRMSAKSQHLHAAMFLHEAGSNSLPPLRVTEQHKSHRSTSHLNCSMSDFDALLILQA